MSSLELASDDESVLYRINTSTELSSTLVSGSNHDPSFVTSTQCTLEKSIPPTQSNGVPKLFISDDELDSNMDTYADDNESRSYEVTRGILRNKTNWKSMAPLPRKILNARDMIYPNRLQQVKFMIIKNLIHYLLVCSNRPIPHQNYIGISFEVLEIKDWSKRNLNHF